MTETDGSTLASSSMVRMAEVKEDSAPPSSDGISMPINPCSNNPFIISGSIISFSSISRTFGATTSFANRRTESRNISSSSERVSKEFRKVGRESENDLVKYGDFTTL